MKTVNGRPITCIAPGCRKPNKGPRFHYLCEEHRDSKPEKVLVWQKDYKAKARKEKSKEKAKAGKK